MVVVIPGFVVALIAFFVLNQVLGSRTKTEPLKGWSGAFVGVIMVVVAAAMFWSTIDDEQLKRITEFWSDFF